MLRESTPCPVCGGNSSAAVLHAPDPDHPSTEPFTVVRCDGCGMCYINPRPQAADLHLFYPKGYYDKPGENSKLIGRMLGRLFMHERVRAAQWGLPPGRILDIGCGEGTFLAAMARRGWDAWGVDVSSEGARRASSWPGVKAFDKPLDKCGFEPQSFDLITMWHSIEHMVDPASVIQQAAGLLKEKGCLYIAFPNSGSWEMRIFGPRWFHLDPPRHLHFFSPATMTQLLESCGLEVNQTLQISHEFNVFGFVQSTLNVLTKRMNIFYRTLKGTFPPGEEKNTFEILLTLVLLPLLTIAALPYTLAAALCGASGCIAVRAARKTKKS